MVLCTRFFSCGYDQIPKRRNLKKGFVVAQFKRSVHHGKKGMVADTAHIWVDQVAERGEY